ncbi:MAG: cyanophycinase [Inhella sp.]
MSVPLSLGAAAPTAASASTPASSPLQVATQPGPVLAIGGALRLDHAAVWNRLVQEAGGPGARIAVFATASENPQRTGERIVNTLKRYGAQAEFIPLAPKLRGVDLAAVRDDPALLQRMKGMQGVFFSGGAQELITASLQPGGQPSPLLQALRALQARGGLVAGTSAGAAVMSEWMFRDAQDVLAVLKGRLRDGHELDRGLGFAGPHLFVDQHFLKRGRIARLLPAMYAKGYRFGLGVEEDSAALIRGGEIEILGARGALLVDLGAASHALGRPHFNLRGAALTYLDRGDRHDLHTNTTTPHPDKLAGRIDPRAADFKPSVARVPFFPDILGDNAIVHAMALLLDSPEQEAKGLAFNGRALLERKAVSDDGGHDPDPTLGFEFRLYKGPDTLGHNTGAWGGDDYSVQRVYLDVTPVRLQSPLYRHLKT